VRVGGTQARKGRFLLLERTASSRSSPFPPSAPHTCFSFSLPAVPPLPLTFYGHGRYSFTSISWTDKRFSKTRVGVSVTCLPSLPPSLLPPSFPPSLPCFIALTFCSEALPFLSPPPYPSFASSFLPTPLQAYPSVVVGSRTSKADTTF